ncbi:TPA: hypothetical protein HH959_000359 [Escherichia coli]|nr:hypothetical protein [Escherichia coli]
MFWRDITLSVWRKKTTGLKTKKRLLPLVLAAALCSSPVWAEEATFTANFKDTDLKSFIETVGANLNKTIIMGPGVQGKVSIRTMTPLNERQYYQLFLNLLEAQGYAVVPMENDVLKVVKSSAAKVEPLPLVGEGSDNYAGDEMVTKVVPVRNVSVRELAPILRQMIDSAGSGNVVNYDPSNVIMLTGRASVVERLTEVIQRVDHAGNRTEEVIPLDNASASEIARVLESLTKNSGENQPATLKSQIVADERTNSVIVSGDPATRDKMRRLIRRLDSEMERSGNSQVFYLKYSKAEDLVDVLKQVSGTLTAAKEEAEGTVGSGREIVSIAASKHSNALIVTAPQDIMQSLQSVIEQLDNRLADYTEQRQRLKSRLLQAMLYPLVLLVVATGVVTILLTAVVPKIIEQFDHLGHALPVSTRTLIAMSDALQASGVYWLAGLLGLLVLGQRLLKNPAMRLRWDKTLLRLPVIGRVARGLNTARFSRTLSILTASSVPLLEGIQTAAAVSANRYVEQQLLLAADRVREGSCLRAALAELRLFPPMMLYMIASGEQSGELETMLEQAAVNQEREFDTQVGLALGLFEPALVVMMAGVVLFIVIAILEPMLQLNNMVGM